MLSLAIVLIFRAGAAIHLPSRLLLFAIVSDLEGAQKWAQKPEVHPSSETVFLGTLAVV